MFPFKMVSFLQQKPAFGTGDRIEEIEQASSFDSPTIKVGSDYTTEKHAIVMQIYIYIQGLLHFAYW